MAYDPTTAALAESYLEALGGDATARNALLACAAALRLDDEVAHQAIALAAGSNGSTDALLRQIKDLGCVARRWDGTWYVTDDVRPYFVDRFEREVPAADRERLRDLLAEHADERRLALAPDGQITIWQSRAASLEAAYQMLHSHRRTREGASRLVATWQQARGEAKRATCEAVEALAPELERHLERLPDEVLFLRGMAAYRRNDRKAARGYFETVWKHGPGEEIHAIAAHLFGQLERDRSTAERALRDSIALYPHSSHQGQVWHSLGNLLSKQRSRWREAEDAYKTSLKLLHDPQDQGRVWHSLGNLLSKQRSRWREAEDAYKTSLKLLHDPQDQGQVRASWAHALHKRHCPEDYDRIVRYALEARALDPNNPYTQSVASRVLAAIHEKQGNLPEALRAYKDLLIADKKRGVTRFVRKTEESIERLRQRMKATAGKALSNSNAALKEDTADAEASYQERDHRAVARRKRTRRR